MSIDVEKFVAALHDYIARAIKPLARRIDEIEARKPEKGEKGDPGEPGKPGEDGDPGKDGQSVTVDQVMPDLQAELQKSIEAMQAQVKAIPIPKDGKDGADGRDGDSVSIDDVLPTIEQRVMERIASSMAKWELDFERRATEKLEKAIDKIPKPRDGRDGKDGRDGLEVKDFDIELDEDGRNLVISLKRGDDRVERAIRLNHMIYRGVWRKGRYCAGDVVTWAGSAWVATKDTESKPGDDDTWRLAVKKGRDGKDKS